MSRFPVQVHARREEHLSLGIWLVYAGASGIGRRHHRPTTPDGPPTTPTAPAPELARAA